MTLLMTRHLASSRAAARGRSGDEGRAIVEFIFLGLLYREWKRRGGDKGYTPPEAGVPSGGDAVIAAPAPRH